jgi:hypothetical protein
MVGRLLSTSAAISWSLDAFKAFATTRCAFNWEMTKKLSQNRV